MNTEYRRDLQHTWMILSEGNLPDKEAYSIRMLTENRIGGLLFCKTVQLDGALRFYYDISARHSLQTSLEISAAGRRLLELLFTMLADTMKQLSEYLLDPDGLLLDPAYIYLNMEQPDVRFCWYPGKDLCFTEQVKALGKALLPHLDQTDKTGIVMGYSFYQHCTAEDVSMETLRLLLHQKAARNETRRPVTKAELERSAILDSFFEDSEETEMSVFKKMSAAVKGWFHKDLKTAGSYPAKPEGLSLRMASHTGIRDSRPESGSASPGGSFPPKGSSYLGGSAMSNNSSYLDGSAMSNNSSYLDGSAMSKKSSYSDGYLPQETGDRRSDVSETVILNEETAHAARKDRRPCLKIREGSGSEKTIWLTEEQYLVGKKESGATLPLSSAAVSRLHARLQRQGDTYSVQDLNSRNMTWLNETILQPEQTLLLSDGDILRFADVACLFCIE